MSGARRIWQRVGIWRLELLESLRFRWRADAGVNPLDQWWSQGQKNLPETGPKGPETGSQEPETGEEHGN